MTKKAKQLYKFLRVKSMIASYVVQASVIRKRFGQTWESKQRTSALLVKQSRLGMKILNFSVSADGEPIDPKAQLYVGNHLSYMDILVFSSFVPTCFVTSQEIKETPVLGFLCDIAGCLFIERRGRDNLKQEVAQISEGLENGCNVVVYPEATSTNGDGVKRFKRPLFGAAVFAEAPVRPFTLNYTSANGEPVGPKNRDSLFWYGDMDFAPHLWELCGLESISAKITFHPAIDTKKVQSVDELAVTSHKIVSEAFVSMLGPDAEPPDWAVYPPSVDTKPPEVTK